MRGRGLERVCGRVSRACTRGGRRAPRGHAQAQISPRDLDARPASLIVAPHSFPRGARTPPRRASPAPRSPGGPDRFLGQFPFLDGFVNASNSRVRRDRKRAETGAAPKPEARTGTRPSTAHACAPNPSRRGRASRRARAGAPACVSRAPFPLKLTNRSTLFTTQAKAQHEMAGADGATEGPPDATYAALEGPRFVTAPEPARQSVLSHSKSHPRMLESASTTGHRPARRFLAHRTLFLPRPNDPRRFSPSSAPLTARDAFLLPTGNATSHVWPLGALAELLDKYAPLDSSRSPFREIARAFLSVPSADASF
jgi:hypothetical protein